MHMNKESKTFKLFAKKKIFKLDLDAKIHLLRDISIPRINHTQLYN